MAHPPAPPDPAQAAPDPVPADPPHPIVPVMACAFCARTVALSARGWRHRADLMAARLPLSREGVQTLQAAQRRRG